MTVYHNVSRLAFRDELRDEISKAYAAVLINMASMKRRLDDEYPSGSKKNARHREISERIAGMRLACELILRTEGFEMPDAEKRITTDMKAYQAAYLEDREFEKSRGYPE
ncbi:hypothetical protein [Nocardia vulneris]|uniref:Uncharacterized protein n=1 Tax=Nocardia vulneris TaxID=1141657 RepID=A0ABR4Z4J0_9NOCA|nr:hypothetical protein [Nocardia vulneris]KIA60246.1 hypothetical protein FG87_38175 [Nocardia vulneris]